MATLAGPSGTASTGAEKRDTTVEAERRDGEANPRVSPGSSVDQTDSSLDEEDEQ